MVPSVTLTTALPSGAPPGPTTVPPMAPVAGTRVAASWKVWSGAVSVMTYLRSVNPALAKLTR